MLLRSTSGVKRTHASATDHISPVWKIAIELIRLRCLDKRVQILNPSVHGIGQCEACQGIASVPSILIGQTFLTNQESPVFDRGDVNLRDANMATICSANNASVTRMKYH